MAENIKRHLTHIKSKVVESGLPKLPTSSQIQEGEIAVNYAKDYETLSIKNESGSVVTFSSDNYFIEKKLGSGFTGENSANTVTKVIVDNEKTISAALNDLNTNKSDLSALTEHTSDNNIHVTASDKSKIHTHSNKSYLDALTGNVGTMAYQNANSYSSATQVNAALQGKANTSHNQASNTITAMTGYASAGTVSAISTNDTLNQAIGKLETRIGGFRLVQITQQGYDDLQTKDPNTLYIIVD